MKRRAFLRALAVAVVALPIERPRRAATRVTSFDEWTVADGNPIDDIRAMIREIEAPTVPSRPARYYW